MNKKTRSLLVHLNVPKETIDKLSDPETAENAGPDDVDVDEVGKGVKNGYKEALRNDDSFLQPIQDAERAKARSTVENKMRTLIGMSNADFEGMDKKGRLDKMIQLVDEKIKSSSAGDAEQLKRDFEALQSRNSELADKVDEYEKTIIPEIKSTVERERSEFKLNNTARSLQAQMSKREKEPREIIIDADAAHSLVMNRIKESFDAKLGEDGKTIELFNKGKETKAYKNDKPVDFKELYEQTHVDLGLTKKSNGGQDGGNDGLKGKGKGDGKGGDGKPKYQLPGMAKAKQALEENAKK